MRSEDCFYLKEKETKKGGTEYFLILGSGDNMAMSVFEDMEELKDHLANLETNHGQPWSMSAVILLDE